MKRYKLYEVVFLEGDPASNNILLSFPSYVDMRGVLDTVNKHFVTRDIHNLVRVEYLGWVNHFSDNDVPEEPTLTPLGRTPNDQDNSRTEG